MPKVNIDLDTQHFFGPYEVEEADLSEIKHVEVSQEILDRFATLRTEWSFIQEYFEHAYRKQEGLTPFKDSPFTS